MNPSEDLDLLVKWLGPESSKNAQSLRSANANNPSQGIERAWGRLDERCGAPEIIDYSLHKQLANFPKLGPKDTKKLYDLSDLLSEIESVKDDPLYCSLLSYYDSSAGINTIVN